MLMKKWEFFRWRRIHIGMVGVCVPWIPVIAADRSRRLP
jgi:hypothetical protein